MKKDSNLYTFSFALAVCFVCSILLSLAAEGLRPLREKNQSLDVKKNILKAVRLEDPLAAKATSEEIEEVFASKIENKVVNSEGEIVEGVDALTIDLTNDEITEYPLHVYKEGKDILAYAIPIKGKGLWSTLWGYLAIEPDAKTVRGITFYQHGETPGLGAEIETDWFQNNFQGKSIWDMDKKQLWPVEVIKGKVSDKVSDPTKAKHSVDGISGATITSNGVSAMIAAELKKYEPFLKTIRR